MLALLAAATVTFTENPPPRFEWQQPTPAEWTLAGLAVALIATDVAQTHSFLRDKRYHETNPLLGEHPSDVRLFLTAGIAVGGLGALWWNLPSPWRSVILIPVIGAESCAVVYNAGW